MIHHIGPAQGVANILRFGLFVEIRQPHDVLQRRQVVGDAADFGVAGKVLAAEAVAVSREQELRLDLRETLDHRLDPEFRRGRRPYRTDGDGRDHGDGRLGQVRHIGDNAVAGLEAELSQLRGENPHLAGKLNPAHRLQRPRLGQMVKRHIRCAGLRFVAQKMLGIIDVRALEPPRARHDAAIQHLLVRRRRLHLEIIPDRCPERFNIGHRPFPQGLIVSEIQMPRLFQPRHVVSNVRPFDKLGARCPQQTGLQQSLYLPLNPERLRPVRHVPFRSGLDHHPATQRDRHRRRDRSL